jgi:UDP-2-acetamido-2,6-beta-L-arabino-hexul-4-ose reductase
MRVLVTGANGFIAKNLILRLREEGYFEISQLLRSDDERVLNTLVKKSDLIFHLAGENRPKLIEDFDKNNAQLTKILCNAIQASGRKIPVIFSSSTQADLDNSYGLSKKTAEQILEKLSLDHSNPVTIFRLPGVFGKWCKPNYNSVVATFCNNVANDLPVEIRNPDSLLRLVYIDDVVNTFILAIKKFSSGLEFSQVTPEYLIAVGELAKQITSFKDSRETLLTERVGSGIARCLYSTYLSYLPSAKFSYEVPVFSDARGRFVEILKTSDSGQFSFFTAPPGSTRGGHYHHTKTEKFLVVQGEALFRFRNLLTNESIEISVKGSKPAIVESIPGWMHDISNIGTTDLIVFLWANEIFDRHVPDTISGSVS